MPALLEHHQTKEGQPSRALLPIRLSGAFRTHLSLGESPPPRSPPTTEERGTLAPMPRMGGVGAEHSARSAEPHSSPLRPSENGGAPTGPSPAP